MNEFKTYTPLVNMTPDVSSMNNSVVSSLNGSLAMHQEFEEETDEDKLERITAMPEGLPKVLEINQILQKRLTANIKQLEDALRENLRRQLVIHEELDEEKFEKEKEKDLRDSDSKYFLRISTFCKPYFKTKRGMPAPMNEDAQYMKENCCLDLYQSQYRSWTSKERRALQNVVYEEARLVQICHLRSRESDLYRERRHLNPNSSSYNFQFNEIGNRLQQVTDSITSLDMLPLRSVPVPADITLDWVKIAAQCSDGHRSAEECQYMWQNILSSNINQEPFSEKDDIKLQSTVRSYTVKKPDWSAIATSLSTPRSAFQVFKRYTSFIAPTLQPTEWTDETTQQLIETVSAHKTGDFIPWSQIHQLMPGYSRTQLQNRWRKVNPERRKGPFTLEEDCLFLKAIMKFGINFQHISKFVPLRNIDQLKDRFKRNLVATFCTVWTEEMDAELIALRQSPDAHRMNSCFWRRLSAVPGFSMTGKDSSMLKLRYLILKLWWEMTREDAPPPLFPISNTTDEEEVSQLIKCFKKADMNDIKELVDKINGGNQIQHAFNDLDVKRDRLHQEHDMKMIFTEPKRKTVENPKMNHLHAHLLSNYKQAKKEPQTRNTPAVDLRKVPYDRLSGLSWPEQMIVDFFLPGTSLKRRAMSFESDNCAISTITALMNGLQVKPLPVQPQEVEYLQRLNIQTEEMSLINSLVDKHTCVKDDKLPCVWCLESSVPECIPLLPPSSSTITALQSLLLHRNTLINMAKGNWLFHNVTGKEVRYLGDKQKPLDIKIKTEPNTEPTEAEPPVGNIHITTLTKKTKISHQRPSFTVKRLQPSNGPKKSKWNKRNIVDLYNTYKSGRILEKYPSTKYNTLGCKQPENTAKTYDAKRRVKLEPKTKILNALIPPMSSSTSFHTIHESEEENEEEFSPENSFLTPEERKSMIETETLLWHRFLSVFLWPAIMTLGKPSDEQCDVVEEQVVEEETNVVKESEESKLGEEEIQEISQSLVGIAEKVLKSVKSPPKKSTRPAKSVTVKKIRAKPVRCSVRKRRQMSIST